MDCEAHEDEVFPSHVTDTESTVDGSKDADTEDRVDGTVVAVYSRKKDAEVLVQVERFVPAGLEDIVDHKVGLMESWDQHVEWLVLLEWEYLAVPLGVQGVVAQNDLEASLEAGVVDVAWKLVEVALESAELEQQS